MGLFRSMRFMGRVYVARHIISPGKIIDCNHFRPGFEGTFTFEGCRGKKRTNPSTRFRWFKFDEQWIERKHLRKEEIQLRKRTRNISRCLSIEARWRDRKKHSTHIHTPYMYLFNDPRCYQGERLWVLNCSSRARWRGHVVVSFSSRSLPVCHPLKSHV